MRNAGIMAAHEAAEAAAMHTERSRLLLEGASKDMQGVRRAQYQRHFGKLMAATQTNKAFKCVVTFLPRAGGTACSCPVRHR